MSVVAKPLIDLNRVWYEWIQDSKMLQKGKARLRRAALPGSRSYCEMYLVFGCTTLFLCELSHQQRNNISDLAAKYKMFGVNSHKEIIRF